ncbi:hypothetical protein NSTC745_05090 [Nostoc sp. DSM 114161]|jgi:hypothetical protein
MTIQCQVKGEVEEVGGREWGDGEMGRWGDEEVGRWGGGETGRLVLSGAEV